MDQTRHAVPWACMQLHKLACSYISLHAVQWTCMPFHELACSSINFHISLSEQLIGILQRLFSLRLPKFTWHVTIGKDCRHGSWSIANNDVVVIGTPAYDLIYYPGTHREYSSYLWRVPVPWPHLSGEKDPKTASLPGTKPGWIPPYWCIPLMEHPCGPGDRWQTGILVPLIQWYPVAQCLVFSN